MLFILFCILHFYIAVDGGFSDWTAWDTCSVTCGSGTQSRTRDCTNPVPEHSGVDCVGDITESQACDEIPCPGTIEHMHVQTPNLNQIICPFAKLVANRYINDLSSMFRSR